MAYLWLALRLIDDAGGAQLPYLFDGKAEGREHLDRMLANKRRAATGFLALSTAQRDGQTNATIETALAVLHVDDHTDSPGLFVIERFTHRVDRANRYARRIKASTPLGCGCVSQFGLDRCLQGGSVRDTSLRRLESWIARPFRLP